MSGMKAREDRTKVAMTGRLVADTGLSDAVVRNVSSRGLMATSCRSPERGSFAEIRLGTCSIVGQVVWSSNDRFGLRAREVINLHALADPRSRVTQGATAYAPGAQGSAGAGIGRHTIARQNEASQRFARSFSFIVLTMAVTSGAVIIAQQVGELLANPMQTVRETMHGSRDCARPARARHAMPGEASYPCPARDRPAPE